LKLIFLTQINLKSRIMKEFEAIKSMLTSLEKDFEKFYDKGNSAAGTRVRKGLQDLKNKCQEIRLDVQGRKNG
jgi:hypothetical protein